MGSSKSSHAPQPTPPPPPPNPELDEPWRKLDWKEKADLKMKLENFKLDNPHVKDIKILVAGQIGAGKSSFINSINSAIQGRICSRAIVNTAASGHSFTKKLQGFTIRSGTKALPFVFKDIMGLEPDNLAGSQIDDIINAVFGHVKDGYEFNEKQAITEKKQQHYTCDPTLSDQSSCLVYIIDAATVQFTDERLMNKLKNIRQRISEEGIPQVVVMTKVDEACPLVKKDLRKIYSSKKIKEKMNVCSMSVGVPLSNIFPVKNYHDETDTNEMADVLILKALDQIINVAHDRLLDEIDKQD